MRKGKRKPTEEQIEKARQRKRELFTLSKAMKKAMEQGKIQAETVNEALIIYYKLKDLKIKELHTFKQWKEKGFKLKKGSKSYPVWSKPIKIDKEISSSENNNYFRICSLFSNEQVEEIEGK